MVVQGSNIDGSTGKGVCPRRRWRALAAGVLFAALASATASSTAARAKKPEGQRALRVCADPNNLPFSNRKREGFENELANLIAKELQARVEYTWWAQRRGFLRNTLNAGLCDVVMGVPASMEMVTTTRPYYRSAYHFVTRQSDPRSRAITTLDDPALRTIRIGVHLIGDDGSNTPPVHALARRGITDNVVGYTVYGDYREDSPPSALIRAVATGAVDMAVAWGPLAGYYAQRSEVPLSLVPVSPKRDGPYPFSFDIALGVRRGDTALRDELQAVLAQRKKDIDDLLDRYQVPRVEE